MRTIIVFGLYFFIIILALPLFLFCFLTARAGPLIWLGKTAISLGRFILGIKLEIIGREKIDRNKPYIFMANHLSFLDGPLLFWIIPQPIRVILKKEIFKIPLIGLAMKHVGFVSVDRKGIKGGKQSIDRATEMIKQKGFSFLIFPEGTRSLDGNLQKFKRGGFFLSVNRQTPIVPMTIQGSYELMPKGSKFVKRGCLKVMFHPIVPVSGQALSAMPELMEKTRKYIQSGLE